ncbi:MAG TPA: helix-turn-helix domain-containing protein [Thermohalobaculum sp.]|nr:helix-turn-helix domain-containing protein [Thermohalobaculum sp.]
MQNEVTRPAAARSIGEADAHAIHHMAVAPHGRQCSGADDNVSKAMAVHRGGIINIVLDDFLAPHGAGLSVLREIRRRDPQARILVVTAHGSIIRNAGEMHAAVLAILRPTLQPTLPPEPRAIEHRMPKDGECCAEVPADPAPGFAAPEQDSGPKAPISWENISADPEIAAAVDTLVGMSLAEVERLLVEATIHACGNSLPMAARVLGASPSTLYRKRAAWSNQLGDR